MSKEQMDAVKDEQIRNAWDFLTDDAGLDPSDVTVLAICYQLADDGHLGDWESDEAGWFETGQIEDFGEEWWDEVRNSCDRDRIERVLRDAGMRFSGVDEDADPAQSRHAWGIPRSRNQALKQRLLRIPR